MRQTVPLLFILSVLYAGQSTTSGLLFQESSHPYQSYFTRKNILLTPRHHHHHHQLRQHHYQQQRTKKYTTTRTRVRAAALSFSFHHPLQKIASFLPLVHANDAWGNWSILTGTAAIAQVLGKTTMIGRLLGPPVTAMAITFGLATIGVINSGGTAAAKSLQLLALQLATPLILLGADLRDAPRRCGPLLISFFAATMATILACLLGWHFVGNWLCVALGNDHDGLVIAAALMAKNIGGGINYMAVCTSLNASQTAIAAGLCVDNIFALVYFPITSLLAAGRPDVKPDDDSTVTTSTTTLSTSTELNETENNNKTVEATTDHQKEGMISVEHVSTVLVLSTTLLWLGEKLGGGSMGGGGGGGGASSLPICTLLTVLLASNAPTVWMSPLQPAAHVLGVVCLYLFFATAGAPGLAVADSVKASILPLSAFLGILYSVHGLILFAAHALLGRPLRANHANANDSSRRRSSSLEAAFVPQRLLVASSAAIGGPATAVALAQAASWPSLTAPCILVGNVGYAVATFLGLLYHAYFR